MRGQTLGDYVPPPSLSALQTDIINNRPCFVRSRRSFRKHQQNFGYPIGWQPDPRKVKAFPQVLDRHPLGDRMHFRSYDFKFYSAKRKPKQQGTRCVDETNVLPPSECISLASVVDITSPYPMSTVVSNTATLRRYLALIPRCFFLRVRHLRLYSFHVRVRGSMAFLETTRVMGPRVNYQPAGKNH